MADHLFFISLPVDVIYMIIKYCSICDLAHLSCTCHKLNQIVKHDSVWRARGKYHLYNTDFQHIQAFSNRHCCSVPMKDRLMLTLNWENNVYQRKCIMKYKRSFMKRLFLSKTSLWFNLAERVSSINHPCHSNRFRICRNYSFNNQSEDVSDFVVKYGMVICSLRDGNVYFWDELSKKRKGRIQKFHKMEITGIDAADQGQCIITGSKDHTIMFTRLSKEFEINSTSSVNVSDRILSLGKLGSSIVTGTAGLKHNYPAIRVIDMNRCQETGYLGIYEQHGAGILKIFPESNFTFLSCGYDGSIRSWDLRTNHCVQSWNCQFDNTIYTVVSDYNNAILSGSCRNGLITLWDRRISGQRKSSIQMYFVGKNSSSVHSLVFDPYHIFAALDEELWTISFYGSGATAQKRLMPFY